MAKELEPIYRMVARDVALGIPLEDIAIGRDLEYSTLKKVASGSLFRKAVGKLQEEIDSQVTAEAAEDPVRSILKKSSRRAVETTLEIMDDPDELGSTRLKASSDILDRAGYKQQEASNNMAVIMLSPEKLRAVKSVDETLLENVPDMVDG